MISPVDLLRDFGYQVQPLDLPLTVYQVTAQDQRFYLVDSGYEFDYLNEEAVIYLLASEQPVLVHVPLLAAYEEYRASFETFQGFNVSFFIQGLDDGLELTRQALQARLKHMGMREL